MLEVIGWQNNNFFELKKKNFLLIRRKQCHGFFSDFINVLMYMSIADKFNLVPVVDIANYPSFYKEEKLINNSDNVWEYYFNQNNSLKEVYKSHFIVPNDVFPGMNINQFLENKIVMYVTVFLSVTNMLGYFALGDLNSIIFFCH